MADEEEEPLPDWPHVWNALENDQIELQESEEHLEVIKALSDARGELQKANDAVLAMRNKIAELKTYKVEPKCVEVIHATFVLLGTDPKEVADWNDVRRMLTPEFFNGLASFDEAENAPSKKAEKHAEKLMAEMDPENVKKSSEALLSLYNWVVAGRKVLAEAAQQRIRLRELAGNVPEDVTGDLYADFENRCNSMGLAPHPHILPKVQSARARAEAALSAEPADPKAKGKAPEPTGEVAPEHECHRVRVGGLQLDHGSMWALAKCLPACTTCVELDFWHANIGTETFMQLASVLPSTAVTTLSLDWSIPNLKSPGDSISQLLCDGSKLRSLSLRSNGLNQQTVAALSEVLVTNTTLTSLDLSNNALGNDGAAPLAAVLHEPTTVLASLSLNACELTDSFATLLAGELGLREYNEEEQQKVNEIAAEAEEVKARNEAAAGKKGGEVEPVPYVPEMIDGEDGVKLGAANRVLVEVMLEANQITFDGVQALAKSLENNGAVQVFYLKRNCVSEEEELQVCEPRLFLSEAKATRDIQLNEGLPKLKELLAEVVEPPPEDEEQDEATREAARLGSAMELARSHLEEKVGSEGILELGKITAPTAPTKSIIQAALSIVGEDCTVTEEWKQCLDRLKQTSTPAAEVAEDEEPAPASSAILEKLLQTDTLKGTFMDPETSLCARYYLDCSKWSHLDTTSSAADEENQDEKMHGDSFQAHLLEKYLLAVQHVADHESLMTQKAAEALNSGDAGEDEQGEES